HESSSSSSINVQPIHPNPISSSSHQTITNGFNSSQQSQPQHSQSQSPVSFKSSIDALSTLISRYQVSTNNTNKPSSTITD
ncbi:unnamed protein product, partial [Rotaria socialis]